MKTAHLVEEVDIEDLLEDKDLCDLYQMDSIPPDEMDEQDWSDVIDEAYFLIGQVLDRKLPKELHKDLLRLHAQLETMLESFTEH